MEKTKLKINPEHYFKLKSGSVIKNLSDLNLALKKIDDDEFNHHVNEEKNDFANWIRHVFGNEKLADKLQKTDEREEMAEMLAEELTEEVYGKQPANSKSQVESNPEQKNEENKLMEEIKQLFTEVKLPNNNEKREQKIQQSKKQRCAEKIKEPIVQEIHAVEQQSLENKHYPIIQIASYVAFGIITGVALAIVIFTL